MVVEVIHLDHAYVEGGTHLNDQDRAHVRGEQVVLEDKQEN
jgi:hypothetical protein